MTTHVVDSGVVIKWYVPEIHSADALRYLDPDDERVAPELLIAELGNILWKKGRGGELTGTEAESIADAVGQADIKIDPMGPLLKPSIRIALETGRTVYDSTYLALAESLSARMVTADRRLYNALQGGPYAHLVLWIEDGP